MNRMRIFILLLVFSAGNHLCAQGLTFSFKSDNQRLVEDALEGSCLLIQQKYELMDSVSKKHFGRGGRDYFNLLSFVGISTTKGIVFNEELLTPWMVDKDFKEYQGKYIPLVKKSSILAKEGIQLFLNEQRTAKITESSLCLYEDSILMQRGLDIDSMPGKKKGWVVWAVRSKNDAKSTDFTLYPIYKEIEINDENHIIKVESPIIEGDIMGGFYIISQIERVGHIAFKLTGVISIYDDYPRLECPFFRKPQSKHKLTLIQNED